MKKIATEKAQWFLLSTDEHVKIADNNNNCYCPLSRLLPCIIFTVQFLSICYSVNMCDCHV